MHKNFGEWYRLVSLEPKDEILKLRWAGVEKWVSTISKNDEDLLETVRIFRGMPEKISREEFLSAFRDQDAAFAQRNNDLEQRVLAGAALVQCVFAEKEKKAGRTDGVDSLHAAILAGIAIESSRLRATDDTLEELAVEMIGGLHAVAGQQRNRSKISTTLISKKENSELTSALEQVSNAPDHTQLRTQVGTIFQSMLKAIRRSETALIAATHGLRCADEETNILWWLAGGSSRDLDKPWSALEDSTPLIAGWELAGLTDIVLSPQNAAAILERVVAAISTKGTEQPLHQYVNAVPEDWAKTRSEKLLDWAVDLAPLSLALYCRTKSTASTWQAFFEATSGLKVSTAMTPERAARLAYVEAMLFSTLVTEES